MAYEIFSNPPVDSDDLNVWNEWKAEALTRSQKEFCSRNPWFSFSKEEIYLNLADKISVPEVYYHSRNGGKSFREAFFEVVEKHHGIGSVVVKELRGHSSKEVRVLQISRERNSFYDMLNKVEMSLEDVCAWLDGKHFLLEESLSHAEELIPLDFKVYCFKGRAKSVSIFDRNGEKTSITMLKASDWSHIPWCDFFKYPSFPNWIEGEHFNNGIKERAKCAVQLAERIAPMLHCEDLFSSFDIYSLKGSDRAILGEITPRPGAIHANKIQIDYLKYALIE